MTILRVKHEKNYTVVNNFICKDKRLSFKAKGIWLYAFSRPDNWSFHIQDLINQGTDKLDAVRSGLKELEKYGYLLMERDRRPDGTLAAGVWTFYEIPQPKVENPILDYPILDKPPLLSTDEKVSIDEEEKNKQKDPASEVAADAAVGLVSPKKKSKDEYPPEIIEAVDAMLVILKDKKPDAKLPSFVSLLHQVDTMIRLDGRKIDTIIKVFRWTVNDYWHAPYMFKQPAKYIRDNFDRLEIKMNTKMPETNKPSRSAKNADGTIEERPWLKDRF